MYGAIIGDLAGSIYEFNEYKNAEKKIIDIEKRLEILSKKELIDDTSFYSDDTILTIAILDSILNNMNYETKLKEYGLKYGTEKLNKKNYFEYMFSESFITWCRGKKEGTSIGNGCMMRISPVGFLFETLEEVEKNAELATIPSHNNKSSIEAAKIVSTVIFLGRNGHSKTEIIDYLKSKYNINLEYKLEELQRTYLFDATNRVLDICLYILFISNDFEDAIRKAISIGGDTDTIACIVGSMAEALYGIPEELIAKAKEKLPNNFVELLDREYENKRSI